MTSSSRIGSHRSPRKRKGSAYSERVFLEKEGEVLLHREKSIRGNFPEDEHLDVTVPPSPLLQRHFEKFRAAKECYSPELVYGRQMSMLDVSQTQENERECEVADGIGGTQEQMTQDGKQHSSAILTRRQRQREECHNNDRYEDDSSSNTSSQQSSPPENAFASLERLLDTDDGEESKLTTTASQTQSSIAQEAVQHEQLEKPRIHQSEGFAPVKTIAIHNVMLQQKDNNDDDKNDDPMLLQDNVSVMSSNTTRMDQPTNGLPQHQSIIPGEKPGHHKCHERSRVGTTVENTLNLENITKRPTDLSSLLEKNRRIAVKQSTREPTRRVDKNFITTANKTKKEDRKRAKGTVAVVDAKSIVGSRPKHWKPLGPSAVGSRGLSSTKTRKSQLAAELAKATTRTNTSLFMPPPFGRVMAPDKKLSGAAAGGSTKSTSKSFGPVNPTPDHLRTFSRPTLASSSPCQTNSANTTLSFTPSFLSHTSRAQRANKTIIDEPVMEEIIDEPFVNAIDTSSSPTRSENTWQVSPMPHQKRKTKNAKSGSGPLAKRLKLIRESVRGDSIRFQSGQYPFLEKGTFEMNDPRNRAKSRTDVTILSDGVSWDNEYQRLTMLGCIHSHVVTSRTSGSSLCNKSVIPAHDDDDNINRPSSSLAWICFSYETARGHNLRMGSQLRVYNAVVFPLQDTIVPKGNSKQLPNVRSLVVCSQLCEIYPQVLPKLPTVTSIAAKHGFSIDSKC